jgi:hypothetical protein
MCDSAKISIRGVLMVAPPVGIRLKALPATMQLCRGREAPPAMRRAVPSGLRRARLRRALGSARLSILGCLAGDMSGNPDSSGVEPQYDRSGSRDFRVVRVPAQRNGNESSATAILVLTLPQTVVRGQRIAAGVTR